VLDVLFQKDARFLEVGTRQALHRLEGLGQSRVAPDQAHADAAAAGGALEHHRVADALRFGWAWAAIMKQAAAGQQGHALGLRQGAGGVLEAEGAHLAGVGPMKAMPAASQASAKSGFSDRKP
jgi:hypothetical protein